jgi:hypothetical protein
MKIKFPERKLRDACGISLVAAAFFSIIVFMPNINITIWHGFNLQETLIFAAQIVLLVLVLRLPAEISPKIKASVAILIFIAIRTAPNLVTFNMELISINIIWFAIFAIVYATGVYLTLEALEEMTA